MKEAGLPYHPVTDYVTVDLARSKRIAAAYEAMKRDPNDPRVKASYRAMIDETLAQWQAIKKTGLKVEFIPEGPALRHLARGDAQLRQRPPRRGEA